MDSKILTRKDNEYTKEKTGLLDISWVLHDLFNDGCVIIELAKSSIDELDIEAILFF